MGRPNFPPQAEGYRPGCENLAFGSEECLHWVGRSVLQRLHDVLIGTGRQADLRCPGIFMTTRKS